MSDKQKRDAHPSEVAMWHRLSGQPDNVTDEGEIVERAAGRRTQSEKQLLRGEIAWLKEAAVATAGPGRVAGLARLAASYLLAGDVETARRYVAQAREALDKGEMDGGVAG